MIRNVIINELGDFVFENYRRKTGFEREDSYYLIKHQKKKDLQLFAIKLTEKKYQIKGMPRKTINLIRKKTNKQTNKKNTHKISKTIKNSCSATKSYKKSKHC